MEEEGRRGRWGCEIKRLFGSDIYDHVIYYDTVGCYHSKKLQRVVITDRNLYLYDYNTKNKPEPFCKLSDITNLDADHETHENYRNHAEYDSHHIFFNLGNKQYHLYTFEAGTDLFWKLKNAIEYAHRYEEFSYHQKKPTQPQKIDLIQIDGKSIPANSYYTKLFNEISSKVVYSKSYSTKIKSLNELIEISKESFSIRTTFFQSTTLLNYLIDTLDFLSDFHTVPAQIRTNRLEQVELIKMILKTISFFLQGSNSVRESLRLVYYDNSRHYKILFYSIFRTEFFILSQPTRSNFFLKSITDHDKYYDQLQEIEFLGVSLCFQLYTLGISAWRSKKINIPKDFFLLIIKEQESMIISGGFHTIVYMLIQMCYTLESMSQIPALFAHSLYDHLWIINYFTSNLSSAVKLILDEFVVEFDVVVTEQRISSFISEDLKLLPEMIKMIRKIRNNIRNFRQQNYKITKLPVQFR